MEGVEIMGKLNAVLLILALESVYLIRLSIQTSYDWLLFSIPLLALALWVPDSLVRETYMVARRYWLNRVNYSSWFDKGGK